MKTISVIIPFYNEGENIERIYRELDEVRLRELKDFQLEILFMDNHSEDDSFERAQRIAQHDQTVRVIRLSRNFGYQANILTGMLNSRGDAAVQLDADGEDDPAIIPQMVQRWLEGYKVVYGVRLQRVESWIMQVQRKMFYRLLATTAQIHIPPDAGDFRLLDRRVVECLREFKESNPYLRGLIAYAGFPQIGIPYSRRARYRGKSKFSWFQYWKLAWDGITSFSREPLNLATWCGGVLSALSLGGAVFYFIYYFVMRPQAPGFTTIILCMLFLAGVQLLFLGVLGAYIGRIFDEVKRRPISIVEEFYPANQGDTRPIETPQANGLEATDGKPDIIKGTL